MAIELALPPGHYSCPFCGAVARISLGREDRLSRNSRVWRCLSCYRADLALRIEHHLPRTGASALVQYWRNQWTGELHAIP
jgi:hypothetical protein